MLLFFICTLPILLAEKAISPEEEQNSLQSDLNWKAAFQFGAETGWTEEKGNRYIGSWHLRWSPSDRITLSTTMAPWLLGGMNGNIRVPIFSNQQWRLSAETGFLRLNFLQFFPSEVNEAIDAVLYINPLRLSASRQLSPNLLFNSELRHYQVTVSGGMDENSTADISGALATSNSHFRWSIAWSLSQRWSLWFLRNRLLYQDISTENYNIINF